MRFPWIATFVLAVGFVRTGLGQELNVGDAAPKLTVKEFVKGMPVASQEMGKV